jgi:hypothetical protein
VSERMSDAELGMEWTDIEHGYFDDTMAARQSVRQELIRARESESALAARVAALEAELAALRDGLTGTPKKAGWYWAEYAEDDHGTGKFGQVWWSGRFFGGHAVLRYWHLPGESYQ